MIAAAPQAAIGAAAGQAGALQVGAQGKGAAMQAAATRAAGWSSAANSVAGAVGSAAGKKDFRDWLGKKADSAATSVNTGVRGAADWFSRYFNAGGGS